MPAAGGVPQQVRPAQAVPLLPLHRPGRQAKVHAAAGGEEPVQPAGRKLEGEQSWALGVFFKFSQ